MIGPSDAPWAGARAGALAAGLALAAIGAGIAPSGAPAPGPAGPGDRATPGPPADTVTMTNRLTFAPDSIVVRAGETVLFRNTSALVHTVTADPSRASLDASVRLPEGASPFDSGRLSPGQSFPHTFETPGRYRYFCVPHEGAEMRGTVVVEPQSAGGG